LKSVAMPGGAQTLNYTYKSNGLLAGVTDFTSSITYDANLRLSGVTGGNGVRTGYEYDGLGRLSVSGVTKGDTLFGRSFEYDKADNINSITETVREREHTFVYDAKNQLTDSLLAVAGVEAEPSGGAAGLVRDDFTGEAALDFGVSAGLEVRLGFAS